MLPLIPPALPRVADRRGRRSDLSKLLGRIQKGEDERRSFRDRRGTPRVAVSVDVHTDDGDRQLVLTTNDLSTFGLSIKGGPPAKKGSRMKLKLFLPDAPTEPLTLKGEVLGPLDDTGGARLRFVSPPVEALRRIHRFLK